MTRLLVLLAKITAGMVVALWVVERAGRLRVEWQDVEVEMPAALALAFIVLLLFLATHAVRFLAMLRHSWRLYRMHHALRQHREGEKLIGTALQAVAEAKKGKALKLLKKAEKLIGSTQTINQVKDQASLLADKKRWGL